MKGPAKVPPDVVTRQQLCLSSTTVIPSTFIIPKKLKQGGQLFSLKGKEEGI